LAAHQVETVEAACGQHIHHGQPKVFKGVPSAFIVAAKEARCVLTP
jgi:hypothetical protein